MRLHRLLRRLGDDDLVGFRELRLAPDDVDLVLLHQEADAVVHALGYAARALDDRLDIGRHLAFDLEAVVLGVLGIMEHLGRAQQRLGRDAAPVGADAGEMLALDDRRLQPELRGTDRSDVAARSRADDDHVIGVRHGISPQSSSILRTTGASARPMARVFSASRWTPSSGVVLATLPASKKPQPIRPASSA